MATPRPYKFSVSSPQLFDRFHRFAGFCCLAVAELVFQRAVITSLGTLISPGDQLAHGDRSFFCACCDKGGKEFLCNEIKYAENYVVPCEIFNPSRLSGYYMYHHFNIQQFHVLPTQCIYVFCMDLRTNSDYFPIQH